jgi:DNA-directed RNA polymerase specialized sigma subunit
VAPSPLRKDENVAATMIDRTRTDRCSPYDIDHEVEEIALDLSTEVDPDRRAELVERIVLLGLPLADAVAMRYSGRGIETDDLVQVARTAPVKAVHR